MGKDIRVCLFGATGRMGEQVIAAAAARGMTVCFGIVGSGDAALGSLPAGFLAPLAEEFPPSFAESDVIIDFSTPAGALKALRAAAEFKIPALICTTALGPEHDSALSAAAEVVPVIRASNTSIGVNAMSELVAQATVLLGSSFDIEVFEVHHKGKKDAPSGTAITLAESAAAARNVSLKEVSVTSRSGAEALRREGEIGIQAARGGDVPGEHTVFFLGDSERIEITHRVRDRAVFAYGALRAAKWLFEKKTPGLYSMKDVLRA